MITVESRRRRANSAHPPVVGPALAAYPVGRIVVPLVPLVGERAERLLEVVPTVLVIECSSDDLCDEGTATSGPCALIELVDEIVVEGDVYTHVLTLAHNSEAVAHVENSSGMR